MRSIVHSTKFIRDLKKAKKKNRSILRLSEAVDLLQKEGVLPAKFKAHKLSGNWSPYFECHIEPDFLLIYKVTQSEVQLIRVGSHDELFK